MQHLSQALKSSLENIQQSSATSYGPMEKSEDLMQTESNLSGQLSVTGMLPKIANGLVPVDGNLHGAIGALVKLTDNPHSNAEEIANSLANSLPLAVKSWLACWISKGWQAEPLEHTPELVQQTRQAMTVIYKLWRPVSQNGLEDKAALIVEVNKMLSNYGYGALPADPLQAKLKVEGYAEILEDAPLWSVQQASKNWRKTTHTNPPTSGEWLNAARGEMGYYAKVHYGNTGEWETAGRVYEKLVAWIKEAKK